MKRWAEESLHASEIIYLSITVRKACKSPTTKLKESDFTQCFSQVTIFKMPTDNPFCDDKTEQHLSVLSATQRNVYGACRVRTKCTQIGHKVSCSDFT